MKRAVLWFAFAEKEMQEAALARLARLARLAWIEPVLALAWAVKQLVYAGND